MIRKPVVNGKFYADEGEDLKRQIENCFLHPVGPGELPPEPKEGETSLGLVVPHAGYMASGPVAAWGYYVAATAIVPTTVILIGPNHTGLGGGLSVWPEGAWKTPLGSLSIDEELGRELLKNSGGLLDTDTVPHLYEHSLEVQLPFLQYIYGKVKILPIVMSDQRLEVALSFGERVGEVITGRKDILLIASSDLNHYETHERTMKKDTALVTLLVEGKLEEAYELARVQKISACGLGPMATVRSLFSRMEVLKNTTSGEVMGDNYRTVGYLAALLK